MHVKPKKRLGQHFLVDKNVRRKILECLKLNKKDVVLEIGAGSGELTACVAEKAKAVYALEIDTQLCRILRDLKPFHPNIKVIHQDILDFDLNRHFSKLKKKIMVLGNIPYYISSPLIEHLLSFRKKIDCIFLTVQKEFAERIVACPGSKTYGSLSCFVQTYTCPEILFTIKRGSFFPVPKVDSSFMRLGIRPHPLVAADMEKQFFQIVRTAFSQRRKTLRNSLAGLVPPEALECFFRLSSKDANIRPERLSPQDFLELTKII
ncbi:MAG: 16S rRNA (adenine(1518)-N(6)/adenine(1519)-N(6))-dimethyltransferase RsmA [Candidatus Omnitrophota bacterium]